jgi:hypothetical protein
MPDPLCPDVEDFGEDLYVIVTSQQQIILVATGACYHHIIYKRCLWQQQQGHSRRLGNPRPYSFGCLIVYILY